MFTHANRKFVLLVALTLPQSLLATDKDEFDKSWLSFSQNYKTLNSVNETFSKQITPHIATFDRYRTWMELTTKALSSSTVSHEDVEQAFSDYRTLLENDKTCTGAALQTIQADLLQSVRQIKGDLLTLKGIEQKTKSRALKKQMKSAVAEAESATLKADKLVLSYTETLGASDICLTLTHYDLILVAAKTLGSTRLAKEPLHLETYLSNQVAQRDIKKEALKYLEAIEDSFADNIAAGEIAQSMMLLNRLEGNIAFGTSAVKSLPESDRADIDAVITYTRTRIKELAKAAKFPELEGLVTMVDTKAKLTHERLTHVARQTMRASDQALFAKVKEYCQTVLLMRSTEPYSPPLLKTLKDVLDYEAQLSAVLLQLKALEKSQELATR